MNILFYTLYSHYANRPVGGAEVSIQLLAKRMSELGERVFFGTLDANHVSSFQKKQIGNLDVYSISFLKGKWSLLRNLRPYVEKIPFALRIWARFKAFKRRQFIASIVRKEKIDVIYSYDTVTDVYDILKAKQFYRLNVKVVKRVAGLYWMHELKRARITKEKIEWVFNNADAVNYLTEDFKSLVLETSIQYGLKIKPKKEIILDIGIDLDLFKFTWKKRNDESFKIVCVSRLATYQKRQTLLIEALAQLKSEKIELHLVGAGSELNSLKKSCQKLEIENKVIFHEYLDQKRIAQLFENSDLFALPTDYEGLSKAVLEAMAVGIPCLVSDTRPLNLLVEP